MLQCYVKIIADTLGIEIQIIYYIYVLLFRQERRVDKMGPLPMCMHQYRRLFSSCRVPGKEKDYIQSSFQIGREREGANIICVLKLYVQ